MKVGFDFDNTIVCYDTAFFQAAVEKGLIPSHIPSHKTAVRDWLRRAGREAEWTALQGWVYGEGMHLANPYPGVIKAMERLLSIGADVAIVSHKTRHPYVGPQYDLHTAAHQWVRMHMPYASLSLYFEETLEKKLERIGSFGCTWFIDDLPECLHAPAFPSHVQRILFDPHNQYPDTATYQRLTCWENLCLT